ncbi:putative secreted protein (Por secretion system target) [Pontibacter ummariensis]|uniref:Por secretion system C-terminal sorting domain-containing protein n=1 Tax=Pontibacter ummariensis TaxID=1610492 RepID=A0A239CQJ0_9BACT|nr:IPT/TIG domain-containing protein [Pontibacter ummariensis]PRY14876.1 putative secreted protein (Por secretion system target) [Pontibacter ummariensis]SNS22526.1 Por secretion system C-terminal sorting domain-containing protein [Pontibacter ummariensis]
MHRLYALTAAIPHAKTVLLFALLLIASRLMAQDNPHMVPLSLEERVQKADIVVEGEVISQQSFWDARHENIYTSNIIRPYKSFKGNTNSERIEVITEGGSIGFKKHVFSSALELRPGQQGVFFLNRQQQMQRTPGNTGTSTMAYGSQQGFVRYNLHEGKAYSVFDSYNSVQALYKELTEQTGQDYRTLAENKALKSIPALEHTQQQKQASPQAVTIRSFSPQIASAGTETVLTINGSGFGRTRGEGAVEFLNADDAGQTFVQPLPSAYLLWTDTQIKVYIPSATLTGGTAGSGPIRVIDSSGNVAVSEVPIVIEYAYSNIGFDNKAFQPVLLDRDGLGGYSIHFAPSIMSRQPAREGFRRAMNTWICVSEVNWRIAEPTLKDVAADDDLSIIRYASPSVVGAGVLARTISRYEGCASSTDTLFWVTEFDMEINSSIDWEYGPAPPEDREFDFETVMLHELGHAHQLSHVILPRAVMFYAIEFARLYRDLSLPDVTGASLVMARSLGENFCGETPMARNLDGDCNLSIEVYTIEAEFTSPNAVTVLWTTRNEILIDEFIVQRSVSGVEWEDIGVVASNGPNPGELTYTFVDNAPLPEIAYYRLKVVYNNTSFSFSPRVRVINPASIRRLRVYPTLVNQGNNGEGLVYLTYIVETNAYLEFLLYDMKGQLVRTFDLTFTNNNTPLSIDLSGLAGGMYVLKWQERNIESSGGTIKLVKL